jgi:Family of unknown function (DUF6519)
MSGDYSRFSFDSWRNFSAVLQQQGRVQLDSDWNEQSEIARRRLRAAVVDVLGRVHVATPDAFKIASDGRGGLTIGRGRIYVDGLVAENHGAGRLVWDAALDEQQGEVSVSYAQQPHVPIAQKLPNSGGPYLVYLDVWEREVSAIEDPALAEPALGGPDTTTRIQTVWQVKLGDAAAAGNMPQFGPPAGRLSTVSSAYLGLENKLYRVEIHDGGAAGAATFKWSRNNASTVARVTRLIDLSRIMFQDTGFDTVSGFAEGGWVEITDDARKFGELPGELRRIKAFDRASSTLTLDAPLTQGLFPADGNGNPDAKRHMRVCRWHGSGTVQSPGNVIALEDGVSVKFELDSAGGAFQSGDYWLFAARSNDQSIGMLDRVPPSGIHHHFAKLALFTPPRRLRDCRKKAARRARP